MVLLPLGVDIWSNLDYFPVATVRNLTKKFQKNSNTALLPVTPSPIPRWVNIDTCINDFMISQWSTRVIIAWERAISRFANIQLF